MAKLAPLSSTLRIVEWEELPASVREIPTNFNPMLDAVFMKHQSEWCSTRGSIVVGEKGRRTGITFAEALDDTLRVGAQKVAGGTNVFYAGDTKDKGLEFIGYMAHFMRVIIEAQGEGISEIEEFLFEDQDGKGNSKFITAYRIRCSSGYQAVALSSRPANIRGLQGLVVIDEAAFHADVQGVIEAATALLIWGGEIRIISTHFGKNNPFNQLIKDIEAGLYGPNAKVYRVTFDDAVTNGLYERRCLMRGEEVTSEGKAAWYAEIRSAYGPRKSAMREELDCIPRDGNGVCIPGVWIDRAQPSERPILRLTLDDDFAHKSIRERESWCTDWIERYLTPVMKTLNPEERHVFGMDFARHRHFSVIWPGAITQSLKRYVPFSIEMNNVPTAVQQQILFYVIDHLPRQSGGSIDATGPGQTIAEYTADKYGRPRIAEVNLSRSWYGVWMKKYVEAFEDETIEIPRDENTAQDHRMIEEVNGIPMISKLEKKDLVDAELIRHGDSAGAGCMMWHASLNMSAEIDYQSTGARDIAHQLDGFGSSTAGEITNTGFGSVSGGNDFGGYQ